MRNTPEEDIQIFAIDIGCSRLKIIKGKIRTVKNKGRVKVIEDCRIVNNLSNSDLLNAYSSGNFKEYYINELSLLKKNIRPILGNIRSESCLFITTYSSLYCNFYFDTISAENEKELSKRIWKHIKIQFPKKEEIRYEIIDYDTHDKYANIMFYKLNEDFEEKYIELLYSLSVRPNILDIDTLSILNCINFNYPIRENQYYLSINIGISKTIISIEEGDKLVFTKTLSGGYFQICKVIADRFNLSLNLAEKFLFTPTSENDYLQIYDFTQSDLLKVTLDYILDELVQSSVDDLKKNFNIERFSTLFLSGGGAYISEINKYLEDFFDTNVVKVNPFQKINVDQDKIPKPALFTSVFGLFLR